MPDHIVFRRGKKVYLRPLEEEDLHRLYRWINDPEVSVFLDQTFPLPLAYEAEFLKKSMTRPAFPTDIIFAICLNEDNRQIGNMGLHRIRYDHGTAGTGSFIGEKELWGQGYGYDAKMILLDFAFNTLRLRKITAGAKAFNQRSLGFNAKCGYKEEGRLRAQFLVNGEYVDDVITAVFREDWLPLWEVYCADWKK
jgi:RimJ/RimL family protein N-acetyltransferase